MKFFNYKIVRSAAIILIIAGLVTFQSCTDSVNGFDSNTVELNTIDKGAGAPLVETFGEGGGGGPLGLIQSYDVKDYTNYLWGERILADKFKINATATVGNDDKYIYVSCGQTLLYTQPLWTFNWLSLPQTKSINPHSSMLIVTWSYKCTNTFANPPINTSVSISFPTLY